MNPKPIQALDSMPECAVVNQLGWEAFLRYKAASWQHQTPPFEARVGLLKYLGMTDDEYEAWVADGVISERVKRIWS